MDNRQTIKYLCGLCNTVLESGCLDIDPARVAEPCPNCGHSLASNLRVSRPHRRAEHAAFHVATVRALTFGIRQLDGFYSGIRAGDAFCIVGPHAAALVTRLSVRAMLPKRQGGLQSPVIFIDARNTSDVYQCVSFCRQYGMDLAKALDSIVVSRAFTVHQLASLVIKELPEAIKRFGAGLVVVSGLLGMFLKDPQVGEKEARRLLREMIAAAERTSPDVPVIVSAEKAGGYEDILRQFKNRLELRGGATILADATSEYGSRRFSLPEKALRVVEVE